MTQEEFQSHTIDVLARLETHIEGLVGNGQPGRVTKLEDNMKALEKARWTLGGIYIGASTIAGAAVHFLFKH